MHFIIGFVVLAAFIIWGVSSFLDGTQAGRVFVVGCVILGTPIVWAIMALFAWGTFDHFSPTPPAAALLLPGLVCVAGAYWLIRRINRSGDPAFRVAAVSSASKDRDERAPLRLLPR